jgi:hypothetical protein
VAHKAEISSIAVRSQPEPIVFKTLFRKKTHHKKRTSGVAEAVGPEFKPKYKRNKIK